MLSASWHQLVLSVHGHEILLRAQQPLLESRHQEGVQCNTPAQAPGMRPGRTQCWGGSTHEAAPPPAQTRARAAHQPRAAASRPRGRASASAPETPTPLKPLRAAQESINQRRKFRKAV